MNIPFPSPFTLLRLPAFESVEAEKAYWEWNDKNKLEHRKLFLAMAIVAVAMVGLLDVVAAGDQALFLLKIRGITVFVMTAVFMMFMVASTPGQRDLCIQFFGGTVVVSLITMTVVAPYPAADFYPFLLSAAMVFGSVLVVPKFSTLITMCIGTNCMYWPTVYFSEMSTSAIYVNLCVMIVTTFSVVMGGFVREQLEREQKLNRDKVTEAREEAIAARDTAILANQAKTHLLANVSHELRTPMNAILGFSEVMKNEMLGPIGHEQYREYIHDIHFAGSLLQTNINDLLDLSRLDVEKMHWSNSWARLDEIIERTVSTCKNDIEDKGVLLKPDVCCGDIEIYCDPERTAQTLINLITNAIKFSDRGTTITISSRVRDNYSEFAVSDQGCGISPEDIEQIIEPFRQVDTDAMTAQKGGMGLGLSIVKGLTKKLDGELIIESEVGKGTTVRVRIPSDRMRIPDRAANVAEFPKSLTQNSTRHDNTLRAALW